MRCPFCSHGETQVLETRDTDSLDATRRRRECLKCERRFTTYERAEMTEIRVVKKDGRRERYDRSKVLNGLMKACEKRPIPSDTVQKIADSIEPELRKRYGQEVDSKTIGRVIMRKLKSVDKVAYIRFASVYREFEDLEEFKEELGKLQPKKKK